MNTHAKKLLEDALQLSETDRAELAASLIDSLDEEVDEDAAAAWDAEILRRLTELRDGTVKPIPWPEARRIILGIADAPAND
jgi:putative addiction module component (TIGR02574 family)